ncbi:STAS domain-containing protein [Nonomuraea roseoviolacea]|uniref:Anti-sigma factor antagonist n=1 Tax=Nonomuraea roseoviolacea subsp. carminata TaxID=160689 RepID=A0ABT1JV23_9ACTN|nr:STAS domain-containing protein [Nonomuraea roseoviolacea]MCP2345603.1 anti-sigma B factor antagonist [Nonomuraea roseoviolacea subsp. carminata]
MTALIVQSAHDQDHTVIALIGDLDALSAARLDGAVEAALYDGRRHLTVDAADLVFCDCSGVGALLRARRAVTAVQGTMTLANVHGVLRRILDVTRLDAAFSEKHDLGLPSSVPPGAAVAQAL